MCVCFSGSIWVFDLKSQLWCVGDLSLPVNTGVFHMTGVSFPPPYVFGSVSYGIFLSDCVTYTCICYMYTCIHMLYVYSLYIRVYIRNEVSKHEFFYVC